MDGTDGPNLHPLVQELKDQGWSASRIAAACGASLRQVYRWQAGEYHPMPIFQAALRRALAGESVAA